MPEVLDVSKAMRCMLLCMLEAIEGGLCLQEVFEVLEMLEVPKVMDCVLETVESGISLGLSKFPLTNAKSASEGICTCT